MKKLVLLVAIAITLISFDSYSQNEVEKFAETLNKQSMWELKQNEIVLPKPAVGSLVAPIVPNTNLHGGSFPKSKKKQPPKGMTIEELSELHGPASTGFGSVPESVSGTELLKSKNSGNKHFKRPK
jgi:hypothetical protein